MWDFSKNQDIRILKNAKEVRMHLDSFKSDAERKYFLTHNSYPQYGVFVDITYDDF